MVSREIFVHFTTDILLFANILLKESLDFLLPGGNYSLLNHPFLLLRCPRCERAGVPAAPEAGQRKREAGKCRFRGFESSLPPFALP
jgi:hypothetical protein